MITASNYFDKITQVEVNALPGALSKSHEFIVKSTRNGSTWDDYQKNETIRRVIDLYLQKLNEYLATNKSKEIREVQKKNTSQLRKKPPVNKPRKPGPESKSQNRSSGKQVKKPSNKSKVEHIREEVKFIRRFVGLHNKVKPPNAILSFIKSLQRAIIQKLIRKTSPFAREIRYIQDHLVEAYNNMKGDAEFKINEKDLTKLVVIAGAEEVYPSINIIKRYIGMQGNEVDREKVTSFIKHIENAKKEKIQDNDPYYDKVKTILNTLKNFKSNTKLVMAKAELNGLECIAKECSAKTNHKSNNSSNSLSGVLTAEEMANRQFERLDFTHPYNTLFGKPATNFTMMVHGEPGAGKTTFLLKFAKYLAETFGRVLYITSEEFSASTMTDKINDLIYPYPENLEFAASLREPILSNYNFIILDSVNDLGLRIQDFKALKKDNPNSAFILILQHTKDGQYRGGKDWEHEVEIAGSVESGVITVYRNRYGVKGSYNFFNN